MKLEFLKITAFLLFQIVQRMKKTKIHQHCRETLYLEKECKENTSKIQESKILPILERKNSHMQIAEGQCRKMWQLDSKL